MSVAFWILSVIHRNDRLYFIAEFWYKRGRSDSYFFAFFGEENESLCTAKIKKVLEPVFTNV